MRRCSLGVISLGLLRLLVLVQLVVHLYQLVEPVPKLTWVSGTQEIVVSQRTEASEEAGALVEVVEAKRRGPRQQESVGNFRKRF